jgi:hypothetical protein
MIKSKRMRCVGHVTRMGEKRNEYQILVEKPEGKTPLVRPRRRRAGNIKIDLRRIGWNVMDCIDLAEYRDQWRALVNTVMNLRVQYFFLASGVGLSPLYCGHFWPIVPAPGDR